MADLFAKSIELSGLSLRPIGLIVAAIGVVLTLFANKIADNIFKTERSFYAIKLASVIICIAGFIIAFI